MTNVVALPNFSVPSEEPVAEVVEILEEALGKAKEGKLRGVAVVMVEGSPDAFETAYHSSNSRHTMAAGVMSLHWQVSRKMSESE
jgi:hypothetical protein